MIYATRDDEGLYAECDSCGDESHPWPNDDADSFEADLAAKGWVFCLGGMYCCPECAEED